MALWYAALSAFWLGLGIVGLVGDNDSLFVTGLVASVVCSGVSNILQKMEKQK